MVTSTAVVPTDAAARFAEHLARNNLKMTRERRAILGSFIASDAGAALIEVAKTEKDPHLRLEAVRHLGALDAKDTGPFLVSLYGSETDAEVVTHLIEHHYEGDLVAAFRAAYEQLEGHFSIVAIHRDHEGTLVGARCQTPLVMPLAAIWVAKKFPGSAGLGSPMRSWRPPFASALFVIAMKVARSVPAALPRSTSMFEPSALALAVRKKNVARNRSASAPEEGCPTATERAGENAQPPKPPL